MINRYFRFLYNFFRILNKSIIRGVKFSGSKLHSLSKHTMLDLKRKSDVYFGKNIQSDGFCRIVVDSEAKLSVGQGTYFNAGCVISAMKDISIGNNCLFGPNVLVFDNNHKFNSKTGVTYDHECEKITIGNNCWIASNVTILKGANIGNNCVIGAGCIIKSEIPTGSIVSAHIDQHIHKIEDR